MKESACPECQQPFSRDNPPKKLKNCEHNICNPCLVTCIKCPLDQKRIDYRRYTAKAFEINNQLLQHLETAIESPKKSPTAPGRQCSPKKQYETCLLHSKSADLICCVDGNLICASCALFGEHRGHNIKSCDQFLNQLTLYTEQALQTFDKLKEKEDNLNQGVVEEYIKDCFQEQKTQQAKSIKQAFTKLIEKVKKAEKNAMLKLDNEIKKRKETLFKQASIAELESKKNQWYKQVQTLGNLTQQAYQFRDVKSALKYFDQKNPESFLLKRGQYLYLEYCSSQNMIKNKIDTEVAKLTAIFCNKIDQMLQSYCTFGEPVAQICQPTPCQNLKQSAVSRQAREQDILIDEISCRSDLSNSAYRKQTASKIEVQNQADYFFNVRIPEVNLAESIQQIERQPQRAERSKSTKNKPPSQINTSMMREVLGPVQNKKRKKIQIPQKYKQVFEDLKNDRCEVIDFGGAELGDQNILALCEYIEKTNKLRNLKLVRNKISDEVIKQLLNSCYNAKVTSLNLGQNMLTEKSLQLLWAYDLGQLRNITLSLNKINRRNVKTRLDEFAKRGITLSI